MTPLEFALTSALFCLLSGLPGLSSRISPSIGRKIACGFVAAGSAAGITASYGVLVRGARLETLAFVWRLPVGEFLFRLDPLSSFFLIPVLLVSLCVSIYGCGYFATSAENRIESRLTFYLGGAVSSIILILLAANSVTLVFCWEAMAIMVFLALCHEHGRFEVREAGLHYLVASHVTTLLIIVLFALINPDGGINFPIAGSLAPHSVLAVAILCIALVSFGMKAGIMPLHIWLPSAHANAPSHVSAIMSGIVIKMGIYGLLRTISFFSAPPLWWGMLFICLGIVSAIGGVLFALGQHDIKRLLAYHSIENIGIIIIGIGVALIGLSQGNNILFVLGMAGALLHVLNHALFKSLLFLGAGAIIHAARTRDIDRMGGLSRNLPVTSLTFLCGAVAICGLPPLNGFVSEFLIYLGIFKGFSGTNGNAAALLALAAPLLALTGGLALACFVKVYGTVFLGEPRVMRMPHTENTTRNAALLILAACCTLIGVLPVFAVRLVEPVIASVFPQRQVLLPSIQTTADLYNLSAVAAVLILVIILLVFAYTVRLKSAPLGESGTWDCGYAAPSSSMQYTASSFAEMLVRIFAGVLRPERHEPRIDQLFPGQSHFESHVPEVVLEKGFLPLFAMTDAKLAIIRRLQNGQLNRYILYIVVALIILLGLSDFY